ncbi:helix-turn-helix domain-containing protein (plasmid) [Bacillus mycoides]|nr:helix-turn-helix domain-containing protein [Bacillus mycoides]
MEKEIYRKIQILDIIASENRWFTTEELSERLHCSEKTVRTDIKIIANTLPEGWEVRTAKGRGIFLHKSDIMSISTLHSIFKRTTISSQIIQIFFNKQIQTIPELSDILFMHPSSLYKILNGIRENIRKFNLTIERSPLRITGCELQVRLFYYDFFFQIYGREEWPFSHCEGSDLLTYVSRLEDASQIYLSLETKKRFIYVLAVMIQRIQQGFTLNFNENLILAAKENPMYDKVLEMCNEIQTVYNIDINLSEQVFITIVFLRCPFIYPDRDNRKKEELEHFYQKKLSIHHWIHIFIELLEEKIGENLRDDEEFIFALIDYFQQIELMMQLSQYFVLQINPNETDIYIQNTYSNLYQSVKEAFSNIEKCSGNHSLDREIIGILTIQVQASLLRKRRNIKRIYVVTGEGKNWRQYLVAQLEQAFTQKIIVVEPPLGIVNDCTVQDYSIDLVVTDFPLDVQSVPMLLISPIPTQRDWDNLYKYILGR